MTSPKHSYHRLPGRAQKGFGFVSRNRQQLWMGEDHLLVVDRGPYSERCKRFYLNDIQAITLCPTDAGYKLNVAMLLLAGCFLLAALGLFYFASGSAVLDVVFDVSAGIFLGAGVALLLGTGANTLYGPTCRCFLYTAVQSERLTALGRLRTAQRSVAFLKAATEAAQGVLHVVKEQVPAGISTMDDMDDMDLMDEMDLSR
jgi:hypothetical protein